MVDLKHSFFRPLWVRILVIVTVLGWGVFEYIQGNSGWAIIFSAIGIYAASGFFINFKSLDDDVDSNKMNLSDTDNED